MISKTKKLMSILLSIVMMLSVISALGFNAFAYAYDDEAVSGLFAARYSKYQVFDVQRSPVYPGGTQANPSEFTVKSFRTPYGMPTTETDDGWFYFKGVGSAAESGVSYGALWRCADEGLDPYIVELWYNDNHGTNVKCSTGVIGGIGTEGFFYEGDSHWGYYFSNNKAYEYNSSLSITYTPVQNGRVVVSRDVLNNYEAGSMLIPDGYYNVTLDPGEGSGTAYTYGAKSVTFANPNAFTAPAGKVFDYWENNTNKYYVGDKMNLSNDATFVAHWVNGVTVTFDSNGGTPVASQTIKPNTTVNAKEIRTFKDGFKLKAWQLNGVDFDLSTPVTENITLTAVWEKSNAVFELDAEYGDMPSGWTIESSNSDLKWTVGVGDYSESTGTHSGNYNFKCTHLDRGEYAYLVSPTLDLSSEEATLEFWFINRDWGGDIDIFDVCYRVSNGEWVSIFSTDGNSNAVWTEESINLPEEALVPDVQIGFKMTDSYGFGVGLDDVSLVKAGTPDPQPSNPNNGVNITVADTISENFYIDDAFYGEDSYVSVNYNHNSNISETTDFKTDVKAMNELTEYSDASSPYNGSRIISVLQAPAQSTEKITINVYANEADAQLGENVIDTIEYSVYDYCRAIINGNYEENLKDLAKSTLDYAAAAQTYFSYNTDNMATKDVSGDFYGEVYAADLSTVAGITSAPSCIKSASVVVKSDLEINLLSKTPIDVSGATIDTTNGGNRFNATSYQNGDYYVVHIQGIEPSNMDNTITVHTSEGDIIMTANAVIKIMSQSSNTNLATLAKAMYLYGVAANNYFA